MTEKILIAICIIASAICIGSITYELHKMSDKELRANVCVMYVSYEQAYTQFHQEYNPALDPLYTE